MVVKYFVILFLIIVKKNKNLNKNANADMSNVKLCIKHSLWLF